MTPKPAWALALLIAATASPAWAGHDAAAHAAAAPPAAETLVPQRRVDGHRVISAADPAVRITLPDAAVYVGAVRWPLYGVADAELHLFVEADAARTVQRFYWVQFEQYLPARPDARYTYPENNPGTVTLSGRTMHVKAGFGAGSERETRSGSDGEAFRALLAAKNYRLPRAIATVRFVELFEPTHRKELMIIYGEDMRPTVDTIGARADGERGAMRLDELHAALIERGLSRIAIDPPGPAARGDASE